MSTRVALLTVAVTSGLVLVLEILAGRLMAPYVGVSLETFTGIIGTILAGIAVGAAVGGRLADRHDPMRLIAQSLVLGGALSWMSIPIVNALGPNLGSGPLAIVVLSACAFLLPAAVLSGIGPMVAKLQLDSLDQTGAVVGSLSGASTFGALVGTFGTGFVLIAWLPVRAIIVGVGLLLVVAGALVYWRSGTRRPDGPEVAGVLFAAFLGLAIPSPCDQDTEYYCVRIVADDPADPDARPRGRSLLLDQLRHAHVDLDDPEYLDIRYMRLFADVADVMPTGPIDALHIGGGGFSLPRYLTAVRPGSDQTVLELDAELVTIARNELGLDDAGPLDIRTGDARLHLADLPTDGFDLVIGDAFGGTAVPWHLTTVEVVEDVRRMLRPEGLYVMNVIDGGDHDFARAQLATLAEVFEHVAMIEPADGLTGLRTNLVLVASQGRVPAAAVDPADGRYTTEDEVAAFIEGVRVLTDDFAPADQLLG